jgi:hypothetical protein
MRFWNALMYLFVSNPLIGISQLNIVHSSTFQRQEPRRFELYPLT